MEISLSTFIFEIINFLILVWILKKIFYAPVKKIIEERKASIEKLVQDAQSKMDQASTLKLNYDNRLKDWQEEKKQHQESFLKEMEDLKHKKMHDLQNTLKDEGEKTKITQQKNMQHMAKIQEAKAMQQGLSFTARLMATFASPSVQETIFELLKEELKTKNSADIFSIKTGLNKTDAKIIVNSAFDISQKQQHELTQVLCQQLSLLENHILYKTNQELLAGFEISCGAILIEANLRDELRFFAKAGPQ